MKNNDPFNELVSNDILSTRFMIGVLVMVEIIIQTFSLMVQPTDWWTWQLLGFITATNLGAVLLAIQAQRQTDRISKTYRAVFTPNFYRTMNTISSLDGLIRQEASKDGRSMDEELQDLAPKLYGFARKYVDVKAIEEGIAPPEVDVAPAPEVSDESELFRD